MHGSTKQIVKNKPLHSRTGSDRRITVKRAVDAKVLVKCWVDIEHYFELSEVCIFEVWRQALYHATPKTAAGANTRPTSSCLTRLISSWFSGSGVLSECDRFTTVSGSPSRHMAHQQATRFHSMHRNPPSATGNGRTYGCATQCGNVAPSVSSSPAASTSRSILLFISRTTS